LFCLLLSICHSSSDVACCRFTARVKTDFSSALSVEKWVGLLVGVERREVSLSICHASRDVALCRFTARVKTDFSSAFSVEKWVGSASHSWVPCLVRGLSWSKRIRVSVRSSLFRSIIRTGRLQSIIAQAAARSLFQSGPLDDSTSLEPVFCSSSAKLLDMRRDIAFGLFDYGSSSSLVPGLTQTNRHLSLAL
jgi:hypothetical protein